MRLGAAVRSRLREPGVAALAAVAALPLAIFIGLNGQRDTYRFGDEGVTVYGGRIVLDTFPESLWRFDTDARVLERFLTWLWALCMAVTNTTADAFALMHWAQALIAASVAIPVALLLKGLGTPRLWAVGGGLVAAAGPWAIYGVTLLNATAGVATMAWVMVAAMRVVRRPGTASDALLIAAAVLAGGTRSGNLPLVAGVGPAIVAAAWSRGGGGLVPALRELVRRHWLLVGVAAVAALLLAIRGIGGVFGTYGAGRSTYIPWDALGPGLKTLGGHTAVATGVVALGFALPWVARAIVRPESVHERAFGLMATGMALMHIYIYAPALSEDRYFAVLTPLIVVPFVHALRVRPLSLRWAAPGALVLGWLLMVGTDWRDSADNFVIVPAAQWWNRVVEGQLAFLPGAADTPAMLIAVGALLMVVVAVEWGPRWARTAVPAGLLALVLVNQAAAVGYVTDKWIELRSNPNQDFTDLTFADRAVGPDGYTMILRANPAGSLDTTLFWETIAFFNRSVKVGTIDIDPQPPCCLGGNYTATYDEQTGILTLGMPNREIATPMAPDAALYGRTILTEPAVGYRVDRVTSPARLAFRSDEVTETTRRMVVWPAAVGGRDACLAGQLDGVRTVRADRGRARLRAGRIELPDRDRVRLTLRFAPDRPAYDLRLVRC